MDLTAQFRAARAAGLTTCVEVMTAMIGPYHCGGFRGGTTVVVQENRSRRLHFGKDPPSPRQKATRPRMTLNPFRWSHRYAVDRCERLGACCKVDNRRSSLHLRSIESPLIPFSSYSSWRRCSLRAVSSWRVRSSRLRYWIPCCPYLRQNRSSACRSCVPSGRPRRCSRR